jgi:hypothetical protein
MLRSFGSLVGLSVALLIALSCSESSKDPNTCPTGSEGCPCRSGNCDAGLECRSSLCVEGAAHGGSASGGSAGSKNGGAGSGNAGASTTGGVNGNAGTAGTTAGTNTTGGTNGGVGGAGTGGSAGTCNDTSSDPKNCGQCGHACQGDCKNGQCAPYPAGCFDGDDGFASCAAYCTSVGESCVAKGCGSGTTLYAWDSDGGGECEAGTGTAEETHSAACDAPIEFGPGYWILRCCCTDTQ